MRFEDDQDDGASEPSAALSPARRRMVELGVVVDRLIEADREIARATARRAAIVEEARLLSEADAAATRAENAAAGRPRSESGWTAEVRAWRELVSEIGCALRLPEQSAERLIAHSRTLINDLPATYTALAAGEISYRHAEKLLDHVYSLPTDVYPAFEQAVLPHACELTVAKFDRKARIIRERTHPESISTRHQAARDQRDVRMDATRDGMAYLTAYLPAHVAVAGYNRIDSIATTLKNTPEETRSVSQLRADVFGDLIIDGITTPETLTMAAPTYTEDDIPVLAADHLYELQLLGVDADYEQIMGDLQSELDHFHLNQARTVATLNGVGNGVTAKVMVTVPVLTLLGTTDEPGILDGYGPIDPDTVRQLAATAPSFTRILSHPETGTTLSIGRQKHDVPADMKRWLQHRDGTCRKPGCNRPAHKCDLDHTADWYYNGETRHDNLAHLCEADHNLKHHTRWRYQHADAKGTLEFTSPTGHAYVTRPENDTAPPELP